MSLRILVVEDNAINMELMVCVLEHRGHVITGEPSVSAAWARLQTTPFDLVALDLQLPGEGGQGLLRRIRQDPKLAGLPVVAVTANSMMGVREQLLLAGFDGYVSKPIEVRTFSQEIESHMKRRTDS